MKDYEVNYVHQESKTIPDVNYAFETAMKPIAKPKPPRTVATALLERWAKDTRELARRMIWYDGFKRRFHSVDGYGENLTESGFDDIDEAWEHQLAYLNSPYAPEKEERE